MQIERLQFLLIKSANGLLTTDEQKELDEWYAQLKDDNLQVQLSAAEHDWVEQNLLAHIHAGIEKASVPNKAVSTSSRQQLRNRYWYYLAASLLLITGLWWVSPRLTPTDTKVQQLVLKSGAGEQKQVKLPDGTAIWLGPLSSVSYPAQFTDTLREVSLSGEAFFEVAHEEKRPFVVNTAGTTTRVLGTTFNIESYPDQHDVKVTLLTGKVRVKSPAGRESALLPDQRLIYTKASEKLEITDYPGAAREMLARRQGILEYNDAPVIQLIDDLNRFGKTRITTTGNLDRCSYYGTFTKGDDIQAFLEELCYLIRAKLTKTEAGYHIETAGCF